MRRNFLVMYELSDSATAALHRTIDALPPMKTEALSACVDILLQIEKRMDRAASSTGEQRE